MAKHEHALPACSVSRGLDDVIFFSFKDINGNVVSVPWSQAQLDSYVRSLAQFRSVA